jgi:hypothetical protein
MICVILEAQGLFVNGRHLPSLCGSAPRFLKSTFSEDSRFLQYHRLLRTAKSKYHAETALTSSQATCHLSPRRFGESELIVGGHAQHQTPLSDPTHPLRIVR